MMPVHDEGGEAALPKIAAPALAEVDAPGVAAMRLAERSAQGLGVRRHQDQVHVVGHQAVGPAGDPGRRAVLGQEPAVGRVVLVAEEDRLAPVATLRHVMGQPRRHHPR